MSNLVLETVEESYAFGEDIVLAGIAAIAAIWLSPRIQKGRACGMMMMTFIGSLRAVKFCLQTRSKEPLGAINYSNGRRPREDEEGEESYEKQRQRPGRGG